MVIEELFETIAMNGGLKKEFKYNLNDYEKFTDNKEEANLLFSNDIFKFELSHYVRNKLENNNIIIIPVEEINEAKEYTNSDYNNLIELLSSLENYEIILDLSSLDLSLDNESQFLEVYISNEEDRFIIIPISHLDDEYECFNQFLGPIQIYKDNQSNYDFWQSNFPGITINEKFIFDNSEFNFFNKEENNLALSALSIVYNALLNFQKQIESQEVNIPMVQLNDNLLKDNSKLDWLLQEINLYSKNNSAIELIGNYEEKIKIKKKLTQKKKKKF